MAFFVGKERKSQMSEEKNQVVIEEPEVINPSTDGMTDEEISKAKEYGLIKEEPKENKKTEIKNEEKEEKHPPLPEINVDDLDSFEKVHDLYQTKPEAFYKLPRHVKNLYHNSKGLYKKLKEEEERRKDLENKSDFTKVQEAGSKARLERIRARLKNPENLTVEELNEILGGEVKEEKPEEKPLTKKDLEDIEAKKNEDLKKKQDSQQKVQRRILDAEAYANANIKDLTDGKYQELQAVVDLAEEMAKQKPRYMRMINDAFLNDEMTESEVVDVILDIARLNPKWGTPVNGEKKDATVDRMVKNANKQQTSASLNGGKGSRVVTYDDLTPEDAVKLSQAQWNALPDKVRKRIMSQI